MPHSLQGWERNPENVRSLGIRVATVEWDAQLGRHLVAHALPLVLIHLPHGSINPRTTARATA